MATVRQTVVTRQTTSSSGAPITITTESQRSAQSPEWDNTLDALLEDLQTSVSRPGSAAGGSISRSGSRGPSSFNGPISGSAPGTMGSTRTYREVKEMERYPQHGVITKVRTVQQQGVAGDIGQPVPPARDFNNVQYLMAANPTHIVAERAGSPMNPEYQMSSTGNNISEVAQQKTVTAYKTISYQYNTSEAQHPVSSGLLVDGMSASPLPPPPVLSPTATPPPQRRHRTPSGSGKVDVQLRQNLNELDNLLDDLNHAQQQAALRAQTASPTSHKSVSPGPPEVVRGTRGIDSSLLEEPLDHSTPVNRHVTHTVRTYRYDTRYGHDDGPHDHNGPHHEGPPTGRQSLPRQIQSTPPPRDHYPSEPRHMQPTPPPQSTTTTVRTYSYGSPNAPPPQTPPSRARSIPRTPVHESPSPARQIHRPYPDDDDDDRDGPTDPLMPGGPRRTTTTTVRTYTYQLPGSQPNGPNEREPMKPMPAPPPPSEPLTYNVTPRQPPLQVTELKPQPTPQTTVVTYKFTTSSGGPQPGIPEPNDRSPRPFPVDDNDAPPSSQQPPKRLDDLMASFSDGSNLEPQRHPESHPVSPVRYTVEEKVASNPPVVEGNGVGPKPAGPEGRAAPNPERTKTKNIAGPPVYYPPGVELFAKKDEPIHARMKESESASKGESKSGGGGAAVVPVCLPLCCAMPCVIM